LPEGDVVQTVVVVTVTVAGGTWTVVVVTAGGLVVVVAGAVVVADIASNFEDVTRSVIPQDLGELRRALLVAERRDGDRRDSTGRTPPSWWRCERSSRSTAPADPSVSRTPPWPHNGSGRRELADVVWEVLIGAQRS
jgi:DNA-binding transcriptional ArsR family regulator